MIQKMRGGCRLVLAFPTNRITSAKSMSGAVARAVIDVLISFAGSIKDSDGVG